jgi:O-glycosyl hydrolase
VEVQTDAIGSGNKGLPEEVIAMPNNLVPSERKRLYKDLLKGFRYCRLAMGLYFRGLADSNKHIVERYPNQLNDLKEMITQSGMEGIAMEYWSPAPYWKSTGSYIGGGLKQFDAAFLDAFGNALVKDITYLKSNGLNISMWGLQNEAVHSLANTNQSYSHCTYTPQQYVTTFLAVAPKIRSIIPNAEIIVDSWDGHTGKVAEELRKDTSSLRFIDAWALHRIGLNSNTVIEDTVKLNSHTFG